MCEYCLLMRSKSRCSSLVKSQWPIRSRPWGGQNSKTEIIWKREASFGKSFFTAFRELFFTVQPKMIEVIDVFLYLGYSTC